MTDSPQGKRGERFGAKELSLADQSVMVAGAGGGIGSAVSLLLAQRGARVICADLKLESCEQSAQQITAESGMAIPLAMDARNSGEVEKVLAGLPSSWKPISGLVNCVGITGATGVRGLDVDLEDFRRVLETNLIAAFVLTRAVLPDMLGQRYGRILHISSIAGKEGNAGMVSYSASKAGLIGMVKAMGKEYATDGITINALAPAVVWTSMVEAMPAEQVDYMTARIPMGRLGQLTEVAEMAAWIVSPAASFTTGFTFDLSGGRATY